MRFANPELLLLLVVPVLLLLSRIRPFRTPTTALRFARTRELTRSRRHWHGWKVHIPLVLRIIALTLLVLAAARPQKGQSHEKIKTEAVDVVLVLDISETMLAEDFKPHNRIHVAKEVLKEFVDARKADRLGLVVFGQRSFTQCPLTFDHEILKQLTDRVQVGLMGGQTAIGLGIASALNALRDSEAKSKVVVLLTDGRNNAGEIDPVTAAGLAKTLGVRIHAVGIGTDKPVLIPVGPQRRMQRAIIQVDEETLKQVAETTGGEYFRATDPQALRGIYDEIDRMERTEIEIERFQTYHDQWIWFLAPGAVLLILEYLGRRLSWEPLP